DDANRCGHHRQNHALAQRLAEYPGPARTQRRSDGNLAPARLTLRESQVCDVRTCDEKHKTDQPEKSAAFERSVTLVIAETVRAERGRLILLGTIAAPSSQYRIELHLRFAKRRRRNSGHHVKPSLIRTLDFVLKTFNCEMRLCRGDP